MFLADRINILIMIRIILTTVKSMMTNEYDYDYDYGNEQIKWMVMTMALVVLPVICLPNNGQYIIFRRHCCHAI